MSKQTAVEWFINKDTQATIDFIEGKITSLELAVKKATFVEQAKAMEKEQIKDAIKLEIKLIGNYFDVGNFDVGEHAYHIRFNSLLKDRYNYYNQD
jgi:hypothetical protein